MNNDIVKPPVRQTSLGGAINEPNPVASSPTGPPSPSQPVPDVMPPSPSAGPSQPPAPPDPQLSAQPPESLPPQLQPQPPKKSRGHVFVIIFSLLVLAALAGVAVKIGLDRNKPLSEVPERQTTQDSTTPAQQTQTDTSLAEIDDAVKTIDSLPSDEDTSGDGLSDQKLGL